ncbi:dienelactone hydrolase endo--beta-d-glucanase [Moniliophthora roreri]|nr:dienelactone hydrolase endo--beta-d-glucanase [Moniliophthora roreri]
MALCDDCIKGVTHEGTPSGQWQKIGGVDCYVATPDGDYPKDKVILFLPDAFGIQLLNNQLLVSDFAANGFKTVAIDYFCGDPVPADIMSPNYSGPPFNKETWFANHGPAQVRPLVDDVVQALNEDGVTQFGATGYCFGGRYTFDLAFGNITKVSVVSHPSRLTAPDDLEEYLRRSKAPLLINSCTVDAQFPLKAQAKADEILGDGKFSPGYKREYFDGCTHGFAVRGDLRDPKVKAGKEGAFKAAVGWFKKYL